MCCQLVETEVIAYLPKCVVPTNIVVVHDTGVYQ
jgi:hypothetical protein